MVHDYRLVFPDGPHAPDPFWEWQQPSIGHLLWHACTFERQVMQCSLATWEALDRENTRLWKTISSMRPVPRTSHGLPGARGWRSTASC